MNAIVTLTSHGNNNHIFFWMKGILFKWFVYFIGLLCFLSVFPVVSIAQSTCKAEKSITQIIITGFTRAERTIAIIPEVSGRGIEVFADLGDPVPADSVFAKIDSTFTDIALSANKISQAKAEKTLLFYENQVARHEILVKRKATALTILEEFELKAELTRLSLKELKNEYLRLQETLTRHSVQVAPGWLVMERKIEPGQWVRAGQVIGRAGDFRQLVVPVAVSGQELRFLQAAGEFPLYIADGNIEGHGVIRRVNPAFDRASRKVLIDIGLTDETLALISEKRGGLRVKIPIIIADPAHILLISAAAVREYNEDYWLVRMNGEQVPIIVLGPDPADSGRLRIVSEYIRCGEYFICKDIVK